MEGERKLVQNIDAERITFVPDRNLAGYVSELANKEIISYNGYCYVHERIRREDIKEEGLIYRLKEKNPEKGFFTAGAALMCRNMKLTTLLIGC
ncbi:hypothetical protein DRZ78_04040 [Candidatus Aerophobetes bacterium]|uniref:Uncharacterized protein n=1 Tax=Aerophobetes bacterium TaxID=2030807 RepID=A0A662D2F9_UNCAE|nr:MAG: hypothetical protein DRZ78_04040 [Candidatus Aerophobetes bacterium]